ncbi:MAG: S8/S53 family peptidase [Planctomycetes bacterium]|nr:S8/S53 family peptidase [Planctomycetota bacterium]
MIRLEGLVPPITAPSYDSRAKRSTILPPDGSERIQQISKAQQLLLAQLRANANLNVTLFRFAPYIALDLDSADIGRLQDWVGRVSALSTGRPFRISIEVVDALKAQCAPPALLEVSLEEASRHLELDGFPAPAESSTVVVIDDRIDEKLSALHGRVQALQTVVIGPAVDVPLSPAPVDLPNAAVSHGTKVALIVAAGNPNARIVGLDVFGKYETSSTEFLANALQQVLMFQATGAHGNIAAVCVSLGDKDMASRFDCDCDTEPIYVGCAVLKPALRDHINLLAAYQIPVVIAAGNEALYEGEVFYPSCLSTAVTVGSSRGGIGGTPLIRSRLSNWGPMLDLCAQGAFLNVELGPPTNRMVYSLGSGSSFAAPFVAAGFSTLLEQHPDATQALIDEALRKNGFSVTDSGVTVPEIRVLSASKWLDSPPPADVDFVPTTIVTPTPTPGPNSPH